MRVQFYRVFGLSVASEIALPGLIAGIPERAPQVAIRRGQVPEGLPNPTASGPIWQIAGKQFLMRISDIARFLLNDGSEIVVAAESEAADAEHREILRRAARGLHRTASTWRRLCAARSAAAAQARHRTARCGRCGANTAP
ncbi:MAG TPA: hypothetical protein VL048_06110 [Xanthobacteraceae bacterium]|nr:hypothetical protein [Xanthobacteraceae bacterium]